MKLDVAQRLILANQYKILALLDTEEARHWKRSQDIVERGYELLYYELQAPDATFPEEACRFILDVLELYTALHSYLARNPKDTEVESHPWSRFCGFDGNHESDHMAFAEFVVKSQDLQWQCLKDCEFNSHMPTLSTYRKLVAAWKARRSHQPMTRDTILEILGTTNSSVSLT